MIEVLVVTGGMTIGGVRQVVTNIVTGINKEHFLVYLYVLCKLDKQTKESLQQENIVLVDDFEKIKEESRINKRLLLYRQLSMFMDEHPHIAVIHNHCNNESPEVLLAAYKHKIPIICTHSHNSYSSYWNLSRLPLKSRLVAPIYRFLNNRIATHRIGCSMDACKTAYGTTDGVYYIPNGVDIERFSPDNLPSKDVLRAKYGLQTDKKIFIFVGRFSEQKNPLFMIRVFQCLTEMKSDFQFAIVGYGEMESDLHDEVEKNGLSNNVVFFSPDSNIPELLKASDYFISPSLYEGLGIVFIEAQLMGLPAFASDQVPREADLGICEFVPLSLGEKGYAEYVYKYISRPQEKQLDLNKAKSFSKEEVVKVYEAIYSGEK